MTSSSNSQEVQSSREQFLDQLETFVEHQLHTGQISIEVLSSQAGISSATLYRKVKEATGLSPVEFTREFQLKKAANLMDTGFGNVSEVAYEAGFNNLSYFSKCFKEKYGINPSSYNRLRICEKDISKYLTTFIGRNKELDEIKQLIDRHRLVNITGPAGTGKTRLAKEVLNHVKDEFDDGVYAVYLDSISDPEFVPSAILQALQIIELPQKSTMETLVEYLQLKRILLLIDNFEHVSAAAHKIHLLLERCENLNLLVTSRVVLRLSGEFAYTLKPLETPKPVERLNVKELEKVNSYPAIQLFKDRAKQFSGDFDITAENAIDAVRVCSKLDGLPLALELAASQIKLISLKELQKRLDGGLSILKSDHIDRSDRHISLKKAIAWSYELLDEGDKRYFQRLSLIPGSFDLDVAEALWTYDEEKDFFDGLRSLSDKNLIQTFDDNGKIRFKLLETLKTFGRNKLTESRNEKGVVLDLADLYMGLAREAEQELNGPDHKKWIDRLNLERDNFRGILKYLEMHGEVRLGLQLSTSLWRYWNMQNLNTESRNWLHKMIDLTNSLNNNELTPEIYELKGLALSSLGIVELLLSNFQDSFDSLQQSMAIFQKIENKNEMAKNLNHFGWALYCMGEWEASSGNVDRAKQLHIKALNIRIKLELKKVICESLEALADLLFHLKDYEKAILLLSAGSTLRNKIKAPISPRFNKRFETVVSQARKDLGLSQFEKLWEKGKGIKPKLLLNMI